MDYRYLLIREEWKEGNVTRVTYGIAVAGLYDDSLIILESYADVCSDENRLTELVTLCNDLRLDPVHFSEVVEDFINSI